MNIEEYLTGAILVSLQKQKGMQQADFNSVFKAAESSALTTLKENRLAVAVAKSEDVFGLLEKMVPVGVETVLADFEGEDGSSRYKEVPSTRDDMIAEMAKQSRIIK